MSTLLNTLCFVLVLSYTFPIVLLQPIKDEKETTIKQILEDLKEMDPKNTSNCEILVPKLYHNKNEKNVSIEKMSCRAVKSLETLEKCKKCENCEMHYAKHLKTLLMFLSNNTNCTENSEERYDLKSAQDQLKLFFQQAIAKMN